jgi:hypothetical protein
MEFLSVDSSDPRPGAEDLGSDWDVRLGDGHFEDGGADGVGGLVEAEVFGGEFPDGRRPRSLEGRGGHADTPPKEPFS